MAEQRLIGRLRYRFKGMAPPKTRRTREVELNLPPRRISTHDVANRPVTSNCANSKRPIKTHWRPFGVRPESFVFACERVDQVPHLTFRRKDQTLVQITDHFSTLVTSTIPPPPEEKSATNNELSNQENQQELRPGGRASDQCTRDRRYGSSQRRATQGGAPTRGRLIQLGSREGTNDECKPSDCADPDSRIIRTASSGKALEPDFAADHRTVKDAC